MRFIIITAPTYEDLCSLLNEAKIGNGKVCDIRLDNGIFKAMVDMHPTLVITTDDLMMDIDKNQEIVIKTVLSA